MKPTKMLIAAALLVSVALPAVADEVTMGTLPLSEKNCLLDHAGANLKQTGTHGEPEPIMHCDFPLDHIEAAMDFLMIGLYAPKRGPLATAWVEAHCHAEPAIPRNKWVCNEGPHDAITRVY